MSQPIIMLLPMNHCNVSGNVKKWSKNTYLTLYECFGRLYDVVLWKKI